MVAEKDNSDGGFYHHCTCLYLRLQLTCCGTNVLMQELARELGNGAASGTLASDSSNVVELVRTQYNVSLDTSVYGYN